MKQYTAVVVVWKPPGACHWGWWQAGEYLEGVEKPSSLHRLLWRGKHKWIWWPSDENRKTHSFQTEPWTQGGDNFRIAYLWWWQSCLLKKLRFSQPQNYSPRERSPSLLTFTSPLASRWENPMPWWAWLATPARCGIQVMRETENRNTFSDWGNLLTIRMSPGFQVKIIYHFKMIYFSSL